MAEDNSSKAGCAVILVIAIIVGSCVMKCEEKKEDSTKTTTTVSEVRQVEEIPSNPDSVILGKWKYYRTVDLNGNRLDESKISPKSPTSFYVYEDGTADFNGYKVNGTSSTQKYTWKKENGQYIFYSPTTGKKAGSLQGSYLIIEQGLFYNGSVKYCGVGFVR